MNSSNEREKVVREFRNHPFGVDDRYVLNRSSGLYEPYRLNGIDSEQSRTSRDGEGETTATRSKKFDLWVVKILPLIVSVLTFILLCFTVRYAYRQWVEANRSANAAEESSYMSCLSAQATQATLEQVQDGASDTRAAVVATVEQAQASIESQRAIVSFSSRSPLPGEIFNNKLSVTISIKNEGKTVASNLSVSAKAVLFTDDEIPHLSGAPVKLKTAYLPSGATIPEKPEYGNPVIKALPVVDVRGQDISIRSREAKGFLSGSEGEVAVFGSIDYSDFSGKHQNNFCQTVYSIPVGSTKGNSPGEKMCGLYNHQTDEYSMIPKMSSVPAIKRVSVMPVNCTKPEK